MSPDWFRSRLRAEDLLRTATVGLRARKLRAVLSGLAIAVGITAVVSVLGITRSSESALLAEIDRIGTNLLTVASGQDLSGQAVELPVQADGMIGRAAGVTHVAATAGLGSFAIFRTDKMPGYATNGLELRATDDSLLITLGGVVRQGIFLNAASSRYPAAVLGYQAAVALGIDRLARTGATRSGPVPVTRIWVSDPGGVTGHWLTVVGILDPVPLAPEIDSSVLVGVPVARQIFGYDGHPSRIYVRTVTSHTAQTAALLAPTAWPEHPDQVQVSRPSDALTARVAVQDSQTTLYLGLGAIAILAGGLGIANVMVVSVLERRAEIGLRRALGASRGHVAAQFLGEALLLSAAGGAAGAAIGAVVTVAVAWAHGWTPSITPVSVWGGIGVALAVGTVAGCYPALRAARLSPTEALRST
ncbi:MAG: ABC transporter permease [Streptosporangiaceae bacterium]|nr:ABC transporter permease [Streptosporangiaceae bacterium]